MPFMIPSAPSTTTETTESWSLKTRLLLFLSTMVLIWTSPAINYSGRTGLITLSTAWRISTGVIFRNVSIPTSKFIKGAMGLRVVESSRQTSGTGIGWWKLSFCFVLKMKCSLLYFIDSGNSNCGNNNGGCEQLCFHMVPTGFTCACQLGMKLKADKKSCEDAFKDGKCGSTLPLLHACSHNLLLDRIKW